ncbi:MAG: DNA repair protein RecO [Bacillales bacterium]|nr:DNA repair protein RecO [Bacillales bacterium]
MEKIEGIIVSVNDFKESSKILNIFTKEYGVIGVIAKGCKSIKSTLRSVTDRLTYGYFYMNYREDKLSVLSSVDVINPFKNIKKDIECISYASYILDLATQVYKQNNSSDIYKLLIDSLIKINELYDPMVITNILELKYLDYLGVMPILDRCSVCGSEKSIATLSSSRGGYICNNCLKNDRMVSAKTIKLIRMFYYVDISKIEKLDISELCKNEINTFLNEYYENYTGLYLKSKNFINNIKKLV